jgi:hypothetical protein
MMRRHVDLPLSSQDSGTGEYLHNSIELDSSS